MHDRLIFGFLSRRQNAAFNAREIFLASVRPMQIREVNVGIQPAILAVFGEAHNVAHANSLDSLMGGKSSTDATFRRLRLRSTDNSYAIGST